MDRDYYSEKTINQFIRKDVCQNDKLLYKYYQLSNAKKFRRRLQILKISYQPSLDALKKVSAVVINNREEK